MGRVTVEVAPLEITAAAEGARRRERERTMAGIEEAIAGAGTG